MFSKIIKSLMCLMFFCALGASCHSGNITNQGAKTNMLSEIRLQQWQKLSEKRIFFGHQSVGYNIILGVNDILKENSRIRLKVVETNDPDIFDAPLFAHARIGENSNPRSKIDAFVSLMDQGLGNKVDIAFFKFCFVDIVANTDVQKVFNYYAEKMEYLKKKYPETTFIHVTVPLTRVQTGPKAWIKKLIGRSPDDYSDNVKRNEYNDLLRSRYSGKEPVFDLAKAESLLPDGRYATFQEDKRTFDYLPQEYTTDGGHLNETGSKVVAAHLFVLLATLP